MNIRRALFFATITFHTAPVDQSTQSISAAQLWFVAILPISCVENFNVSILHPPTEPANEVESPDVAYELNQETPTCVNIVNISPVHKSTTVSLICWLLSSTIDTV